MMGKHRYDEYRKTNLFQNDKVIRPRLSRRTRQQTNESIRIESDPNLPLVPRDQSSTQWSYAKGDFGRLRDHRLRIRWGTFSKLVNPKHEIPREGLTVTNLTRTLWSLKSTSRPVGKQTKSRVCDDIAVYRPPSNQFWSSKHPFHSQDTHMQ